MKKHIIECPHCSQKFEFVPPKKIVEKKVKHDEVMSECIRFWLKEFHVGWSFGGMQGKSLKELLKKIRNTITENERLRYNPDIHILTFKYFCYHLPEFYQNKEINVLNSKYNEIVEEMKKGETKIAGNGWYNKNSKDRYSEANRRFKN